MSDSPDTSGRPPVVAWTTAYEVAHGIAYVLLIGWGVMFLLLDLPRSTRERPPEVMFAMVVIGIGVALSLAFLAAPFLPRRPWVWGIHLALIGMGMMSICVPVCIPLFIYWLKPEVRAWFGGKT